MTALDEASTVLGVVLTRVERDPDPGVEQRIVRGVWVTAPRLHPYTDEPLRRGWRLHTADGQIYLSSSDELRSPSRLNLNARRLGRDPSAPTLAARDGRRLLRLLHEAVENQKEHRS